MKYNKIPPENPPTEKEIVFCISLYFKIPKSFNRYNPLFKTYLFEIVEKRFFLQTISDTKEKKIFEMYLTTQKTKRDISLLHLKRTTGGVYLINRNLKRLVFEIMQDFDNDLLQVKNRRKSTIKKDVNKLINTPFQKTGTYATMPTIKKKKTEIINDWKKHNPHFIERLNLS